MALTITFLGHAGMLLSDGDEVVAIDPFLTGNPVATIGAKDVKCGHVVMTHGHEDHFSDAVEIAKANDAVVYGAYELATYCGEEGVARVEPGNPGGRIETSFGFVAFTQAFHSSSFKGRYMGMPCGVVVGMGGKVVYHTGDTCLFGDMKMIGELYGVDVMAVCAGDRFTMGPEHAARAAELVGAKTAIPIHWGTWPVLAQNMSGFTPHGINVKLMSAGDSWVVDVVRGV